MGLDGREEFSGGIQSDLRLFRGEGFGSIVGTISQFEGAIEGLVQLPWYMARPHQVFREGSNHLGMLREGGEKGSCDLDPFPFHIQQEGGVTGFVFFLSDGKGREDHVVP